VPAPVRVVRRGSPGRTAWAAAEVWVLTVVAHTAAGGGLPSLPWLVAVAGLVALSTGWALRGVVRLRVMVPVLSFAQLALHVALAGMTPQGHGAAAQALVGHPGGGSYELSARMLTAHGVCAVLTAVVWWLRRWVVQVVLTLARAVTVVVRRLAGPALPADGCSWAARSWLVGDPGRAPPRRFVTA
jgi:hypothetical protein